jgi:hypothetical protein
MLKLTMLFALVTAACAVEPNASSIESLSETCEQDCDCDCDCPPPPPPPGPTCTVRGREVSLDDLAANVDSNDDKVSFCHATGSASNPYILLTTNVEGCNGHADHTPGGNDDIFPSQGCAD